MKAADMASRPSGPWPVPGDCCPFAPRRILVIPVLLAALISAGCPFGTPEPVLIREPRPEPVPVRIGVYYPPEFQSYTYRHHFSDTAWILGEPSVKLIREALALLFIEVVEVPRPGSGASLRNDLAVVIEPRIASAEAVFMSEEHFNARLVVQPVRITYGFTLYSPSGKIIATWDVTGRGEGPVSTSSPLAAGMTAFSTLKRNFEHAMREAAWKFTSGFRNIPEVRRWLAEQTGRKD